MSAAALRKGWCPGALRPMATGDGLLVRIRPRGGALALDDAATIAACARRYGNGHLDLTSRANLQIRGVQDATLPPLIERLADAGLLDADAGAESVRNIVVSPLAGLDPDAASDIRPTLAALEQRFAGDTRVHGLPAKFGISIDDGGRFGLADVVADLRFTATAPGRFALAIGDAAEPLGGCRSADLPDVASAVAGAFLRLRRPDERLRDVAARLGPARLKDAVELEGAPLTDATFPSSRQPAWSRHTANLLGPQRLENGAFFGAAAPFGSFQADDLTMFAAAAREVGAGEIRLTPWRAMLAAGLTIHAAQLLATRLTPFSLILDPGDPRVRVAACPGAPACRNATTDVRAAAEMLAPIAAAMAPTGIALHVSGCRKGCAHAAPAPVTLVAEDGSYSLVRNGTAAAAPVATGLTLPAAAERLRTLANAREAAR